MPTTADITESMPRSSMTWASRASSLLTNNPDKIAQLDRFGVTVEDRVPALWVGETPQNREYLATKAISNGPLTEIDVSDES